MGRVICQAKNREAGITPHSSWPLTIDLRCGCKVRKNLGESHGSVIWQNVEFGSICDYARAI